MIKQSKMIVRTKFIDRACHWTVVICFFLVALSGIALFFPTLQWLTETFGTPQMGRILHPWFGVLIFFALMFMLVRFVHHNIPDKHDIPWVKGIVEVLKGNEHKVARVGKYNAGQKMMFWTIMSMIFVLLVTGVIIWRPWFADYFPIWKQKKRAPKGCKSGLVNKPSGETLAVFLYKSIALHGIIDRIKERIKERIMLSEGGLKQNGTPYRARTCDLRLRSS
ncbi:MAG: formate dehydrogenase-N subunit gamma [Enterobacter kobei]|nr:formate dehydrogenase-N subunit gamma [Enterobacter kobei]